MTTNTSTQTLSLNHCFVTVDDVERALGFYHEALGLPIVTDVTLDNGYRWTTLGVPSQPGLEICLQVEGCIDGMTEADQAAMTELRVKGLLNALIFTVDDVDALFDRLVAGGAEVISEPADQFYGVRDCAFRDPAGNMVRFNQPLPQR